LSRRKTGGYQEGGVRSGGEVFAGAVAFGGLLLDRRDREAFGVKSLNARPRNAEKQKNMSIETNGEVIDPLCCKKRAQGKGGRKKLLRKSSKKGVHRKEGEPEVWKGGGVGGI